MSYKVQLIYFRPTGKFLTHVQTRIDREKLSEIWEEIHELRRIGQLPGLRPKAGRDLLILVDVIDHPERVLHLVLPPFVNEEDITPIRVSTGEMPPLVRVPLEELPSRTTTRDVLKSDPPNDDDEPEALEEITPVDRPAALRAAIKKIEAQLEPDTLPPIDGPKTETDTADANEVDEGNAAPDSEEPVGTRED